jgi:predicted acyl esterase
LADEAASKPGAPVLPCRTYEAVPIGEVVRYRVPLVDNARRFRVGHRIRVVLAGDDQNPETPAIMGFRDAPVGTAASRLSCRRRGCCCRCWHRS